MEVDEGKDEDGRQGMGKGIKWLLGCAAGGCQNAPSTQKLWKSQRFFFFKAPEIPGNVAGSS